MEAKYYFTTVASQRTGDERASGYGNTEEGAEVDKGWIFNIDRLGV